MKKRYRKPAKRGLAWLLAFTLCVSLLGTFTFAADENIVFNGVEAELKSDIKNANGGTVTLEENYLLTETLTITGTVTLDLNGHTLAMTAEGVVVREDTGAVESGQRSVIKVASGGKLTLEDSSGNNSGTITGGTGHDGYGGGVYVDNGGTFTMNGGTISGNTAAGLHGGEGDPAFGGRGGGVYVAGGGSFIMSDGAISGNTAKFNHTVKSKASNIPVGENPGNGGGVYVATGGSFTMSGGAISGNTAAVAPSAIFADPLPAASFGGGVFVEANKDNVTTAAFTMSGGTISNNKASSGGGVYVAKNGSFEMKGGQGNGGGKITGNTATDVSNVSNGGGVFISAGSTFTMENGEISNNKAVLGANATGGGNGGGVFVAAAEVTDKTAGTGIDGGTFNMKGGTISGNEAVGKGGSDEKRADDHCDQGGNGGGVYLGSAAITKNPYGSEEDGDGYNVFPGGQFTMENGEISENKATRSGGGVYVGWLQGGILHSETSTFTMSGGSTVTGNIAGCTIGGVIGSGNGGGVYVSNGGKFTMDSGVVENNAVGSSPFDLDPEVSGFVLIYHTVNADESDGAFYDGAFGSFDTIVNQNNKTWYSEGYWPTLKKQEGQFDSKDVCRIGYNFLAEGEEGPAEAPAKGASPQTELSAAGKENPSEVDPEFPQNTYEHPENTKKWYTEASLKTKAGKWQFLYTITGEVPELANHVFIGWALTDDADLPQYSSTGKIPNSLPGVVKRILNEATDDYLSTAVNYSNGFSSDQNTKAAVESAIKSVLDSAFELALAKLSANTEIELKNYLTEFCKDTLTKEFIAAALSEEALWEAGLDGYQSEITAVADALKGTTFAENLITALNSALFTDDGSLPESLTKALLVNFDSSNLDDSLKKSLGARELKSTLLAERRVMELYPIWVSLNPVNLTIKKTVKNADGTDLSPDQENQEFTFTLTLTDLEGKPYTEALTTDDAANENTLTVNDEGKYTFTLKHGESLTIKDLLVGMKYTVEETGSGNNYTCEPKSGTTGSKMILADKTEEFVNTYIPPVALTITKTVKNTNGTDLSEKQKAEQFNFVLTLTIPKGKSLPDSLPKELTQTAASKNKDESITYTFKFSLAHDGKMEIADLPYGTTYEVKESSAPTGYKPEIADGNGKGELTEDTTVAFVNKYTEPSTPPPTPTPPPPPTPRTGNLTVRKTVKNADGTDLAAGQPEKNAEFTFTVELSDKTITGSFGTMPHAMTFVNGVAEFTLKDGEYKTATGLPAGTIYTVTEKKADGYTTTFTGETGSITRNSTATAEFTNTIDGSGKPKTGDLTVSKTVVNGSGDLTQAMQSQAFTFTVTLDDTAINGTFGEMTFVDGKAEFTLKHGESMTAEGLPAGTTYTVTEKKADGYTTTFTGETGSIIADDTAKAEFTNTVDDPDKPKTGDLTVSKTVVNGIGDLTQAMQSQAFAFTVTLDDTAINGAFGEMTFVNGKAEFTLKHGESMTATGLPAGTGYTVTETGAHGYTADRASAEGTIPDGTAAYEAFTNTTQTELPDPNDPGSPDEITIIEDDVPKDYKKVWDDEEEEWVYIPEDDIPLVPKTGEATNFWPYLTLLSAGGLLYLLIDELKKSRRA